MEGKSKQKTLIIIDDPYRETTKEEREKSLKWYDKIFVKPEEKPESKQ
jgi:hypothetical protein